MLFITKFKLGIVLAGLAFLLLSCAKDASVIELTTTSSFPLSIDSRWRYEGIRYTVPFNDSSLADTSSLEISRHIIGMDSLGLIPDLVVSDDTVLFDSSGVVDTTIHRQWLKLEDDKLNLYAYDEYNMGDSAEPVIYDFSHKLLDFPLSGGKAWVVYSDSTVQENRTVVGADYQESPNGLLYCNVVFGAVIYTPASDTLMASYEWIATDGLIRQEYYLGKQMISDNSGHIIDSVRTYENWELLEIDIKP